MLVKLVEDLGYDIPKTSLRLGINLLGAKLCIRLPREVAMHRNYGSYKPEQLIFI